MYGYIPPLFNLFPENRQTHHIEFCYVHLHT